MPKKPAQISNKLVWIVAICIIIVAVITALRFWMIKGSKPDTKVEPRTVHRPLKEQKVIDYNKIEKDEELQALMQKRKEQYGFEKGIDLITKSDESFKVGESTVSMQEILDKIRLKSGAIVEKDIQANKKNSTEKLESFGIYVVQPKDNIWNIHFNFLKDYFKHKGISLSPLADEPIKGGQSSGIGKLLKFSERTVNIYNLKERKLDVDLNLIYPLSKVVVYNMDQIFTLLDFIDYEHINRIQFDGETLWIPPN